MRKIILGMVVMITLIVIAGCAPQQAAPQEVRQITEVIDKLPSQPSTPVQNEKKITAGAELVGNIGCIGSDALQLTLYNVEDDVLDIAADVQFLVNSLLVAPLCDQTVLSQGQSTVCTLRSRNLGFTPTIIVATPENRDVRTVTC